MSDFYSSKKIKKTRKSHTCFGCCKKIPTEDFLLREKEITLIKYKEALENIRVEINLNEHFEEINIFLKDQLEKIIDKALNKEYNEKWLKEQDNGKIR